MKPSRLLALATCAFAFWAASCPAAGEVISVNIIGGAESRSGKSISSGKSAGVVAVDAAYWNQVAEKTATEAISETVSNLVQYATGATSAQATSASVTIRAKNAYTSGVAPTNGNAEMVYGYLDDGQTDAGYGAQMAFSFIPYSQYDLYVYIGSDTDGADRTIGAVEVNGTWYPAQSTAWGVRNDSRVAEVTLTENRNYLKIAGLTSASLTIKGAISGDPSDTRTGLAGVQIVNKGDVLTATNYTATASNTAVTFSDVIWSDGTSEGQSLTGGALNTATLTLEPGSTLTFTEAVPKLNKLTLVSTGKVTLAVSGLTQTEALANVANLSIADGTEVDIGALTASAVYIEAGATLTMNAPGQVTTLTQNGKVKYAGGEELTLFDIQAAAQANKTTIIDKTISSVKTSKPDDRNREGYFAINGARTIELGESADITVSTRFAMADDGNATPSSTRMAAPSRSRVMVWTKLPPPARR